MSKLSSMFKKEKNVIPMSHIITQTQKKLGEEHAIVKKMQKLVDDFKQGKETLHIAIETNKKFKVEKGRFFQEEYVVEDNRIDTFLNILSTLDFKAKKEQQKDLDSFLSMIVEKDNLETIANKGYILLGEPPMLEIKVEPAQAIIELESHNDLIDLSK